MYVIDREAMGKRIRKRRKEMKLTQEQLAEIIDVSTSHIGEIERGTGICSLNVLVDLATTLELNLDTLVKGVTDKNIDMVISEKLESLPDDKKEMCLKMCESFVDNVLKP